MKDKAREFLAATGLTHEEFARVLPAFAAAAAALYPAATTAAGQPRQRQPGGGVKGVLRTREDQLVFILVSQKTYPLQTIHGWQFGLSQPQTNYWIQRLLPVLQRALGDRHMRPEREARQVAARELVTASAPDLVLDGTERRRQRPQDAEQQVAHYSGNKKAPTDKNLLLVNSHTSKVVYLGPTLAGKTPDKKAADQAEIAFPAGATVGKDTGFQGYEPEGVLTSQPKKSPRGKSGVRQTRCSIGFFRACACQWNT